MLALRHATWMPAGPGTGVRRLALAAIAVGIALPGCTDGLDPLREALAEQYPGATIGLTLKRERRELELTVDSLTWSGFRMPEAELEPIGRRLARFAFERYPGTPPLDAIRVDFIQESEEGLFGGSRTFLSFRYPTADLLAAPPRPSDAP